MLEWKKKRNFPSLIFLFLVSANAIYCLISGDVHKDSELHSSNSLGKEKSASEPIIVPIVLKMAEFDHKVNSVFNSIVPYYTSKCEMFILCL